MTTRRPRKSRTSSSPIIAPYKYPRDVRFVTELPRNPSGKLQHFKLRETVTAPTDLAGAGPVLNPA